MWPALLCAFFFAWSAIFSQRSTRIFGSIPAHFFRLCGACVILTCLAQVGQLGQWPREALWLFLASGVLGFGVGDAFLFAAYPRLGSRITLLIQFCVGALTGAVGDWWLLGRRLSLENGLAILLILSGLVVTLQSQGKNSQQPTQSSTAAAATAAAALRRRTMIVGITFALCSAICMGLGTVVSHHAIEHAAALPVPPTTQAWLRVTAGMVMAALLWQCQKLFFTPPASANATTQPTGTTGTTGATAEIGAVGKQKNYSLVMKSFWLGGTMLMGPVLGVSCYQWALGELRSSAIVLAVAATSAIFIIPMARLLERDKPRLQEIAGTVLAVGGIIWLRLVNPG